MEETVTQRGFGLVNFTDSHGVECSLQKSSAALHDAIWLGCNEPNPRALVPGQGWQDIKLPEGTVSDTRMHLTREQVASLLPYLQHFVDTGEI